MTDAIAEADDAAVDLLWFCRKVIQAHEIPEARGRLTDG